MQNSTTKKLVAYGNGATALLKILPHINRRHNIIIEVYNPSNKYFQHIIKIKEQERKLKERKELVVPVNSEAYHGYWSRRLFKVIADTVTPELQEVTHE
jgi:hypothetical protein